MRGRVWTLGGLFGALLALFILGYGQLGQWTRSLEDLSYDARMRAMPKTAPDPSLAAILIDQHSKQAMAERGYTWPWPRSIHAQLIRRLQAAGAKVIAFDVLFEDRRPAERASDDLLVDAARTTPGTVLGAQSTADATRPGQLRLVVPFPVRARKDAYQPAIGFVEVIESTDKRIHKIDLARDFQNAPGIRALGVEMAAQAGNFRLPNHLGADQDARSVFDLPVAFAGDTPWLQLYINYATTPIPTLSYYDVLTGAVPAAHLKGKVLIVCSAVEDTDRFSTPLSKTTLQQDRTPGGLIHAQAANTILTGGAIEPAQALNFVALALLAALNLALALVIPKRWLLASMILEATAFWWVTQWCFIHHHLWLNLVVPMVFLPALFLGAAIEEKWRLTRAFKQFLPSPVVEKILADQSALRTGGVPMEVSVLFSDIRGYTNLSESMAPEKVMEMLNEYHETMNLIFTRHRGTVFDYQGDAQMVVFGAPQAYANHPDEALAAAMEMVEAVKSMRAKWTGEGKAAFDVGVGICTGVAAVGIVGGRDRKQYAAIGDVTNTAARVQAMSQELNSPVLLAASTHARLTNPADLIPLGEVSLKGKSKPLQVFGLPSK